MKTQTPAFVQELLSSPETTVAYDYIVFGDGSGTKISSPGSWFCTAWKMSTREAEYFWGASSNCTNNRAEVLALITFLQTKFAQGDFPNGKGKANLLFVSDSEITVNAILKLNQPKANLDLWAMLDWYARECGCVLFARHVKRNSNPFNTLADEQAGFLREEMVRCCWVSKETCEKVGLPVEYAKD